MIGKFFSNYKSPQDAPQITDQFTVDKMYRQYRWRMFFGMYLGYVFFYFTRLNLSIVLPVLGKDMNISMIKLGIIISVSAFTYGIGKFLSGCLADRANIRYFLVTGLIITSIINLIFGTLETIWAMIFFWGLNGVFQSMGFPPIAKGLVYWFSSKERATKWTIWSSSHTAGTFFVGILIAFLLKHFGWRAAFYVPGILGLLISVFLFNRLRDRPTSLGLPPIEEYTNEPMPITKEEELNHRQTLLKHVFGNPYLWSLCVAYVFVYLVRFGTLHWATTFMCDVRGINVVQAAFMWSMMPLLGMPGGIVAGWIADKFFRGRCTPINLIYLGILAASIWGFYTYASMNNFYLTCFFLACIGFFVDGPQNLVGGVQVSRITVPEAVSTATGLSGMFGYAGAIIAGVGLAAVTATWGWGAMYIVCILSCAIAGIFISFTWKKESRSTARQEADMLQTRGHTT